MPDILHRVGIGVRPHRVFDALTTIGGLRGWWISMAFGDPHPGGEVDFGFCRMLVLDAVPNERVHWRCVSGPDEWMLTEVIFELSWKSDQTIVLFKHAKWK